MLRRREQPLHLLAAEDVRLRARRGGAGMKHVTRAPAERHVVEETQARDDRARLPMQLAPLA